MMLVLFSQVALEKPALDIPLSHGDRQRDDLSWRTPGGEDAKRFGQAVTT